VAATNACFTFGEQGIAVPAKPNLTTQASAAVPAGGAITDTATLTGGYNPGGTITFTLYGPADPGCAGPPVFSSTKPVGSPTVSDAYTPPEAGVYKWVAAYTGDANNLSASGGCGDPNENVTVSALMPTVTAFVHGTPRVGSPLTGSAVLGGAYKPSGTITFRIYGAGDTTCAGAPVFSQTVPVATPTSSGPYGPPAPGTYRLVAAYSGDRANAPATSSCGDPRGTVAVTGAGHAFPTSSAPGQPGPTTGRKCVPAKMALALTKAIVAALTGRPGSAFRATCGGGVRIVLRSREIRPGFLGVPRHDGYTTIGDTLTNVPANGQVAFSINSQGIGLRRYAKSIKTSLLAFVIVHVKPNANESAAESIRVFSLR